ncbi:hypothetical protein [uncultured Chryseobacterium sp.]|uniref:hypothetical protein n=1 Tax=uncultured Chryseobacterium sp. TaxID=259322 RepID=UPI0025F6C585|nr:hypothetical protein [uncultured Chryseobacterium sp.]
MKIKLFILTVTAVALSALSKGQVGINNNTPKATLDVTAKTTDGSRPEGIIAPRLTGDQIKSADAQYGPAQKGAVVYATAAVSATSTKTINISMDGYYYFDGNVWQKMISGNDPYPGSFSYGDIKYATQSSDHNGWVLLDGRPINALTATQQSTAVSLGFSLSLPDASNVYPVQNGQPIGSIAGFNTRFIAQNQLPNITPSVNVSASAGTPAGSILVNGVTSTMLADNHSHSIGRRSNSDENSFDTANGRQTENSAATTDRAYINNFSTSAAGAHNHTMNPHSHSATFTGNAMAAHSHTITAGSINGGVTQQVLSTTPKSMSINMFIYLGN